MTKIVTMLENNLGGMGMIKERAYELAVIAIQNASNEREVEEAKRLFKEILSMCKRVETNQRILRTAQYSREVEAFFAKALEEQK